MKFNIVFQMVKVADKMLIFKQIYAVKCCFEESASRTCKCQHLSALFVRSHTFLVFCMQELSHLDTKSFELHSFLPPWKPL